MNTKQRKTRTSISWQDKVEIYRLRVKGKRQLQYLATKYNCSFPTISNIIKEVKEYNKEQKTVSKIEKYLMATEYNALKTKKEKQDYMMEAPSRYQASMNELQDLELLEVEGIKEDIANHNAIIEKYDRIIAKLEDTGDFTDPKIITAMAQCVAVRNDAFAKVLDGKLKKATRFGIVDQTPKGALIDQSHKSINLNKQNPEEVKKAGIIFADSLEEYEELKKQYEDSEIIEAEYTAENPAIEHN